MKCNVRVTFEKRNGVMAWEDFEFDSLTGCLDNTKHLVLAASDRIKALEPTLIRNWDELTITLTKGV